MLQIYGVIKKRGHEKFSKYSSDNAVFTTVNTPSLPLASRNDGSISLINLLLDDILSQELPSVITPE